MKEKIFELLKLNQVDFKFAKNGDFYDFLVYCLNNKLYVKVKTFFNTELVPCYTLHIKVIFKNDRFLYKCVSYDFEKCILFFNDVMTFLGVFSNDD